MTIYQRAAAIPVSILVLLIVIVVTAVLISARMFIFSDESSTDSDQSAAKIEQSAAFRVQHPRTLPPGFRVSSSANSGNGTFVNFVLQDSSGRQLTVSQQPKPAAFDIGQFVTEKTYRTSIGSGYLVQFDGKMTGIIVSDSTMTTIVSPTGDTALVESLINSY